MSDISITDILLQSYDMIENDHMDEVYKLLAETTGNHPEWVDQRFQAELKLLTKLMENRLALNEFGFLRSISLAYRYCESVYAQAGIIAEEEAGSIGELLPERDTIWWCWLQGFDNAPALVQCCYRSLEKLGKKIIILDENNIHDYVALPEYIEEKYRDGLIGKAHYADLVRLELLTKLGGTWIDSTAFITGIEQFGRILDDEDLFMYRSGNVSEYIIFDNWLMQAKRKSAIFEATKKMLYSFWGEEDKVKHYFLFHVMMSIACKRYNDEYTKIPAFSNEPAHILQYELERPFSEKRWEQITRMSDVHKLTYKIENKDHKGSFLEYILSKGV